MIRWDLDWTVPVIPNNYIFSEAKSARIPIG
jgi:hypothetical protein